MLYNCWSHKIALPSGPNQHNYMIRCKIIVTQMFKRCVKIEEIGFRLVCSDCTMHVITEKERLLINVSTIALSYLIWKISSYYMAFESFNNTVSTAIYTQWLEGIYLKGEDRKNENLVFFIAAIEKNVYIVTEIKTFLSYISS